MRRYTEPAPACSSSAAVRVSATMGGAELAPFVSHPVAAVSVNARKPRPGQDSTLSSRQRVSTVSAQTAPGKLKVSPSPKAQRLGTPREAPGSPILLYGKRDLYHGDYQRPMSTVKVASLLLAFVPTYY